MSIIPSFFSNQRSNVFDPFSLDIWDPFQGFPFSTGALAVQSGGSDTARKTSQLANIRIDWKETPEDHIFRADLPGVKKEEVKVEVEEGGVCRLVEKEEEKKYGYGRDLGREKRSKKICLG